MPAFDPLTFHCQAGVVPPFTGVAVKVTEVPAQIELADSEIVTPAVNTGFTVMVTVLEVAGDPDKQGVALEVSTQVMISLLAGV